MNRKLFSISHSPDRYTREDLLASFDHNRDIMFLDGGMVVKEIYCNTDCTCGLQFVVNWWTLDQILGIDNYSKSAENFWDVLNDNATQYICDVASDDEYDIDDGAYWACVLMCDADIVSTQSGLFTAENREKLVGLVKGVCA